MKTKITVFLCALFLNTAPGWAQTWNLSNTMSATLDNKGTLTIKTTREGGEAMPDYNYYYTTIPWYDVRSKIFSAVTEPGVTSIGNCAFYGCNNLASVSLPDSLTRIGDYAFNGCSGLASVTIPATVTSIGKQAFYNCSGFSSITIPVATISIAGDAFGGCSGLISATIHATLISDGIFSGSSITTVTFGHTVKHIGSNTFSNCQNLISVTIPNPVESIGHTAFSNCKSLESVTIGNSVESLGANAFANCSKLASISFSKELTTIGANAFSGCAGLESVVLPAKVETIGVSAFQSCTRLKSVEIPRSVTAIGANAFNGCNVLAEVAVHWATPLVISANTFTGVNLSKATLYVPEGTEDLYREALVWKNFGNFSGREPGEEEPGEEEENTWRLSETMTATLDSEGTLIISGTGDMPDYNPGEPYPWYDYRLDIQTIIIESGVTSISDLAFISCRNMTSVSIPEGVTRIGSAAFQSCFSLTSIHIPASVVSIGNDDSFDTFLDCTGLTSIIVEEGNTAYSSGDGVLFNSDKTRLIQYPGGKAGHYDVPRNVTTIGNSAFRGCLGLTSLTISGSVTTIGSGAFSICSNLTSVAIPASVRDIGSGAFSYCHKLTDVTVGWATPLVVPANTFEDVDVSAATLHVPAGTEDLYREAPVWKDFKIAGTPTANESLPQQSLNIYTATGSLHVNSAIPCTLSIYTPAGTLIKQQAISAGETTAIALPRGLYIVKAGKEVKKVAIR